MNTDMQAVKERFLPQANAWQPLHLQEETAAELLCDPMTHATH